MKSYYLRKNLICSMLVESLEYDTWDSWRYREPTQRNSGGNKTNAKIRRITVKITDNNSKSQPGHRHGQASPVLTANLPRKKSSGKINLFRGHLQLLILTTEITPNPDGPKLKVSATRLFHLEVV